jgi:hypothetical protein
MSSELWTARSGVAPLSDELTGLKVEGRDGTIGKVQHVSYEGTCLIVTTGRLLGKTYVIPAWAVERAVPGEHVIVDLTKDEVEASPEYDEDTGFDADCEARVAAYYEDLMARR